MIVSNTTVQPFGVNGAVPIDFNSDGQIDFEIDHDRIDLGGGNIVDFLQLDKNDTNGSPIDRRESMSRSMCSIRSTRTAIR